MASMTSFQTNSEAVREFTAGAGQPTPNQPTSMTNEEVLFLTKMILMKQWSSWRQYCHQKKQRRR